MNIMMKKMSLKYLLVCFLIIACLFIGSSCIIMPEVEVVEPSTPPASPPPPQPVTPINPEWKPPSLVGEAPELPDFVAVIAKVKPSVVAISTQSTISNFFTGQSIQEGAGSGWIISKDGYIVTNNHVVEGAETIEAMLDDGSTYEAKMVRTDPLTDLAVMKIDAQDLPAAKIGSSAELQVGEWVVAIGNSLGRGISATKGIVSALEASVPVGPGQTLYDLVQTDAAINPGNSGGPLVNMKGEVVGINSVKVAQVGVEGMGYSISTRSAMPVIEELIKTGYVTRPWLGVGLFTVDESIARQFNLPVDEGVVVTQIANGSPADMAGLEAGDVITLFNGEEVKDVDELVLAIHNAKVGQSIEIAYWREDAQYKTTAIMAESPPPR